MKALSVFEFSDSKAFLKAWIAGRPRRGHGEKSKIAAALGCHSAYVSQVLEHDAQFSFEQGAALTEYVGLGKEEARFYLLLLQRERAGTRSLKNFVTAQIDEILTARTLLRNRLEKQKILSAEAQATYYSSWHYAAAHVAVSIPAFSTRNTLAKALGIGASRAGEVLAFLTEQSLVIEEGGRYRSGTASLYLPENSPLVSKHHANWRFQAMRALDEPAPFELHYSSVATLRAEDLPKARAILVKAIEEVRHLVRTGTEEDTVFCYGLDLFRVASPES